MKKQNNNTKKLYTLTNNLDLYDYYSKGKLQTKDGSNMPFLLWPNDTPCLLPNLYMLQLRDRPGRGGHQGVSRRGPKGGTMGLYASQLSQLIRFCYMNKWDFIDLTDDKFTLFINGLRAERAAYNVEVKKKNEQTITAVGRICLDFLYFVGQFYEDNHFVSEEGTIRAQHKVTGNCSDKGKYKKSVSYWHHHTFSSGDRLKTRNPISVKIVEQLREGINSLPSSRFIMLRRQCLISALEYTGARVGELARLRVKDVEAATQMYEPMLRIITLKQDNNAYRLIPVTKMFLADLKTHIRIQRSKIIKKTIGLKNDHGYFFISATTGQPLKSTTLSEEIYNTRKATGITEQACAHMFRHAFISNLFVLLIQRHKIENVDEFRRMLIDYKTIKAEIMQWTGHKNEASLDQYIKPAFAQVANYAATISSAHIFLVLKDYDRRVVELTDKLERRMPIVQFKEEMSKLICLRNEDCEIAKSRDSQQFTA